MCWILDPPHLYKTEADGELWVILRVCFGAPSMGIMSSTAVRIIGVDAVNEMVALSNVPKLPVTRAITCALRASDSPEVRLDGFLG